MRVSVHDKTRWDVREEKRRLAMASVEQRVLPLTMGDKLTRKEFLRRWQLHPEIKRAELIGGIVYMPPSPVSAEHGDYDNTIATWVGVYRAATPGCAANSNATTLLLQDCSQPDGQLRLLPEYGGSSRIGDDGYVHGPPELAAEICKSSAAYDLHQKLALYQQAGVQEYLAVLIYEQEIRWHVLAGDTYQLLPPDADGVWRSRVFPGLWLDGAALVRGDAAGVLAKLQKGLASAEHRAFVEQLAQRRK
jgi:Uma2 family endonuclease